MSSFAPVPVADVRGGDDRSEEEPFGVHGDVPFPAVDLLAVVEAAGRGTDGVGGLDRLGAHDPGGRLGVAADAGAQPGPEPVDQQVWQAALAPALEERVDRFQGGKSIGSARHSTPLRTT